MRARRGDDPARDTAWVVVAGGGTAGHVYPGLAVAEALVRDGHTPADFHFAVSRRALDAELVLNAGFAATPITARGLRRRLSAGNLIAAAALARGVWQCWRLLGRLGAQVVLAQGGYVSAACALAARLRRIPVVVLEANAVAGLANRLAARWAAACAVAFPGTALGSKVVTGLPVRREIALLHDPTEDTAADEQRRVQARRVLGVPSGRRLVVALGGSLGAASLNEAVRGACDALADCGDLSVRHVVGSGAAGAGTWTTREAQPGGLHYEPVTYETDMPTVLAAADLVVGRAGGGAVAELAVAGRAAVLVPLPHASGGHQAANAAALAEAGAALVVPEEEFGVERLVAVLRDLLADPRRLQEMGRAAARMGSPDAAERVADLLRAHALATPKP